MAGIAAKDIYVVLGAVVALLVARFIRQHRRVQVGIKNIPGPKSTSLMGNYASMHDHDAGWEFFDYVRANFGSISRITTPIGCNDMLLVSDPQALLHILRKDEDLFWDPPEIHQMLQMILGPVGMHATHARQHHAQRRMLDPLFAPAFLRHLPPAFYEVTRRFVSSLQILSEQGEVDISHWGTRASLEMVIKGTTGLTFDPLTIGDAPALYGEDMKMGFNALATKGARLGMKYFLPLISKFVSNTQSLLNLSSSPDALLVKRFVRDLDRISESLYVEKKNLVKQGIESKDMMSELIRDHILIDKPDLDEDELKSHLRTLIFAGTDTTSSAILRTISVLAEHPDIQRRVREEILAAKEVAGGEELTFAELQALPLLDAVYRETLRLYPPVLYIDRVALKDTVLPLAHPITDLNGKRLESILVPKNTVCTVSIIGSNRSTDTYGPDALEWVPDRWLEPLPSSVKESKVAGIYSSMLSFIDGKRHCLGYRLIQLELKIMVSELLCNFEFSPSESHEKITWPMGFVLSPFVDGKMSMPVKMARV